MPSAMRSMWKGVIQFGLVAVPVKLHLATDPHTTGAHLLHVECLSRIQQKTWCSRCACEIGRDETVRGYEVAPDRWVTVTDDELAGLPVKTLHAIEVSQFITGEDAARLESFARQPYFLAPEALGRRSFALLCATLEDVRLVAIAKLTIRDREHIATIRVLDDGLLLTTLAWPDEVRAIADLDLPSHSDLPEAELRLARDLVYAMQRPFEPASFRDDYADALQRLIEAKADGAAFATPDTAPTGAILDLMAALQASVAAAVGSRDDGATSGLARKRAPAKRRAKEAPANAA